MAKCRYFGFAAENSALARHAETAHHALIELLEYYDTRVGKHNVRGGVSSVVWSAGTIVVEDLAAR